MARQVTQEQSQLLFALHIDESVMSAFGRLKLYIKATIFWEVDERNYFHKTLLLGGQIHYATTI
jgi:hypothetical protein